MLRNKFFSWGSSSLLGHVVLFEVLAGTPLLAAAIPTMYSQDTLTVGSALRIAILCAVLVALGASLFWYTFSLPLIRRRDRGR